MKISPKYLIGGALIGLILVFAALFSLPDGKLHLVFCDVGQGDAIFIRAATGEDILIDGGPNDKVLSCLGRHMPFYDRTIELVILSHPQADHLNGLISVIERYNVRYFVSNGTGNETEGFRKLISLIKEKNIAQKTGYRGEKITLDGLTFKILWPEKEKIQVLSEATLSYGGRHPEVLSKTGEDLNDISLILRLSYGEFAALFTADASKEILQEIGRFPQDFGEPLEVLKVPHHGSKTGLSEQILEVLKPKLAVISVGKNSYGHPAEETLKVLRDLGVKTLRTDKDGEIEVVSDGKGWQVKD